MISLIRREACKLVGRVSNSTHLAAICWGRQHCHGLVQLTSQKHGTDGQLVKDKDKSLYTF